MILAVTITEDRSIRIKPSLPVRLGRIKLKPDTDRDIDLKLLFGIVASLLLIVGSLPTILTRDIGWIPDWLQDPIVQFTLATPVLFWGGKSLLIGAWKAARQWRSNLNTLTVIGTVSVYLYGIFGTFAPQSIASIRHPHPDLAYSISAMLITLMLLGRKFEQNPHDKIVSAVKKLIAVQPQLVRIIQDGAEINIPIDRIEINQVVAIYPGEIIPVDGIVIAGKSMVDESIVTGAYQPIEKQIGDRVIGGMLNHTDSLNVRVTQIGGETFLAGMIELVSQSSVAKQQSPSLFNRSIGYFLLIAIAIGILNFLVWMCLAGDRSISSIAGISVLTIACPCALGLANSVAMKIGRKKGIKQKILIKNRASLELLNRLNIIVFDRTGTLTTGQPIVTDFIPTIDSYHGNDLDILQLVGSVESRSEYPYSIAISNYARSKKLQMLPVQEFQRSNGRGVAGIVNGKLVQIGSSEWMTELGMNSVIHLANQRILTKYQQEWEAEDKTVVWLAIDREFAGIMAIDDPINPTAIETIVKLKKLGLEVVLLARDKLATAQRFATKVGIDRVFAAISPQEQVDLIQTLQSTTRGKNRSIVAMVGSRINNVPALAQADVAITIQTSNDIAIAASDITIMSANLQKTIAAIELSHLISNKLQQNLFFSLMFNIIILPIMTVLFYLMFGWLLNPILTGTAIVLTSVTVFANALRLKK